MPLARGDHIIGRAGACDIVLPDKMVSRRHARLEVTDSSVILHDEGSMNGIYLERGPAVLPFRLEPGTVFQIGPFELALECEVRQRWDHQVTLQVSIENIVDEETATSRDLGPHVPARIEGYLDYAQKALGEANVRSVERSGRYLRHQLDTGAIPALACDDPSIRHLTDFALTLARDARARSWLDCLFVVAQKRREVLPSGVVTALEEVADAIDLRNDTFFRIYLINARRWEDLTADDEHRLRRLDRLSSI
jgi:hypothetical protein